MGGALVKQLVDRIMAPFRRVAIEWIVARTLDVHRDDVVRLNRQQLQAGTNADGSLIRPFYKPLTVRIKKAKGQPADRVTLRDTGSFYGGMYAQRTAGGLLEVSSTDDKTEALQDKYGDQIFGLSEASREQLVRLMQPTLQNLFMTRLLQ